MARTGSNYLIVGAGIHGLSTAYHLALELKSRGLGSGADITVIDKTSIAAGASGIACGVIRNNYFQPAMRELMAHSVEVWESDPAAYHYHPVGYMQISPEVMHADVAGIAAEQKAIGYESEFIEGGADCLRYMRGLFDDWQAAEHHIRPAREARRLREQPSEHDGPGREGRGGRRDDPFRYRSDRGSRAAMRAGPLQRVLTNGKPIEFDYLVVAVGPWVRQFWAWLEQPMAISVQGAVTVPCTTTCRCGATCRCRKARSVSTRIISRRTTATCRP